MISVFMGYSAMIDVKRWMVPFACLAVGVAAGGFSSLATAAEAPGRVVFAPHRAVYDVQMARGSPGTGVADMSGRLVYELKGSACEGYTQDMRFVTTSSSSEGSEQVNDMRQTSFEEPGGRTMRFNSAQYHDQQAAEVTQGQAGRRGSDGTVLIELTKPARKALSLPGTVYFPIQHSIAMLEAAKSGARFFPGDVYDGSEKGDKVSATSTLIGKAGTGAGDHLPAGVANVEKLAGMAYWPVATSYFEKDKAFDAKDQVPNYEMAAHFYENGVSTHLLMDYGEFALKGELTELTFLPASDCPAGK